MSSRKLILSFIAVSVLSSFVVSVEADSLMWSQTYGGTGGDHAYSLVETSDGGYAIAGYNYSVSNTTGYFDFWLVKTDAYGNMMWNQTYGGATVSASLHCSLIATSDGGYALAGRNLLVKTDEFGNMEWNKTYEGPNFYSLAATSDEGYIITGFRSSFADWADSCCLIKTDSEGNVEWEKYYGGMGPDHGLSVVATSDGGYAVGGLTYIEESGDRDFWLIKTDASGRMEWDKTYGGTDYDYAYSVVKAPDGGYALAGYTRSFGTGGYDFWLVKTDLYGNMEWNRVYGGPANETAYSLIVTSDGGYALAGDNLLVKTDEFGNMEWSQIYDGGASVRSLVETSDGGYAMAGSTGSAGGSDFWLIKTDEYGVVPEYSSWVLLSIMLVATFVIVIYKKKFFDDHP